jgi:beta-glucanase (GH16 family)/predicted esterase
MKNVIRLTVVLMGLSCCLTSIVRADEDFKARKYSSADGHALLYRIHTPKNMDTSNAYPLILFFHGAGERGDDNERQLVHGVKPMLDYSRASGSPAIIVAPQCPKDEQWVNVPWAADAHRMPQAPSHAMGLAIDLLKETMGTLPVDPQRVYVTGLSMGGFGTWDILQRMPDVIAAAMPVCGGGDTHMTEKMTNVPIWAFHGGRDTVVKTQRTRDMIAAIKKVGGSPKYTEYEGVGHNSWSATYSDQAVLKWMFQQRKNCDSASGIPVQGYTLVWADEFDGTALDMTKWNYRQLGPRKGGVNVRDTVSVDGKGHLILTTKQSGAVYHTAMIATQGKFDPTYGYFECRVQLQKQIGHWSAFWLQTPTMGHEVGNPTRSGTEIDIYEYLRREGDAVHHTLHWDGYGKDHKSAKKQPVIAGLSSGWHTFGLLWTKEQYVFYIDGKETWRTNQAVSQRSEYLILSQEVGKWAGDITQAELPDHLYVDYVRVYQADD